ncbi:hypothetical protein NLJ89_g770 [Agrocybe chaxingu]|uniref:Uncharacterized protein n=1 Tax=Agrocybe chaxingu TaxID=84603 RepID=A0A9W8N196_9AGAR|nr:hypothetical protein NLJ89_g770 [Agrocybe chaxingu]
MAHSIETAANAGVAGAPPTETTTAKKRGRKKADVTTEDRPTKRRKAADPSPKKTATVSVSVSTVDNDQAPKQKKGRGRVAKAKANEASRKDDSLEPKWKIVAPPKSANELQNFDKKPLSAALKPRVWFSDRDELLATLPELSGNKCVNGVSWLLYDTPVILLDESSVCLQLYRRDLDARTLDIVTTRSYTCPLQSPSLLNDPSLIAIATDPLPDLKPDLERPIAKLKPHRKHKRQVRTHYPVKMESMHAPIPPSHASEFSMYIPSEPFHQPDFAGPSSYNLAPARWPTIETNRWTVVQADTAFLSQSHQRPAYVPYPPRSHSPPQFVQGSSQQPMAPAPLHPPLEAGPSPPYRVTAQPYVLGDPRSMKRLLNDAGLKVGVGPTHMVDVEQCGPFQYKWLKLETPKPASPRVS